MPKTAVRLAAIEWARLERDFGLSRGAYGTARFRRRSPSAFRTVAGSVTLFEEFGYRAPVVIEHLDPESAAPYLATGLEFASVTEIESADAPSRIAAAMGVLLPVPCLARTMGALLGAIHILKPSGADYDVSHSDPDVPFSVFIGLSSQVGPLDRLRLAEELVHECMHLLLTLLENERALVGDLGELHLSPWQGRLRPTRGVLHGFYVFSVLDVVFAHLSGWPGLSVPEAAHARRRRGEIADELAVAADALATSSELTQDGRGLVAELITKAGWSL